MPMLVVIPGVKGATERSSFDHVGERRWEFGLILDRLEQRFDVRIIVGHVGPRMALGYAKIGEHERNGL